YYDNDDGNATSFDRSVARIIPLTIESINEEKLHIDWTSFLPTEEVRTYYIHYTCLNNGEVKSMKVAKRFRHSVLRGLRPGFTYGISVMAVDKSNGVLYTSDKSTVQMNAPPNAPIVAISERTTDRVKLEWRPAASYGEITVVGYKIFVNNRLAAILAHDQLSYTLTNGLPCDIYIVHVQALSSDKNVLSPMSRGIKFAWPGVKPGAFKRIDDGQTGAVIVVWENPQLEDETEKLLGYRIRSENVTTLAVRSHGEYDAATNQATIHNLTSGKYRLWLEIQTENHCVCARPIIIVSGRFGSLRNRASSYDARFGCKVLAYDIKPNENAAREQGFQYVTIDELLTESDIISLHAPLNDSTYHLINREALNKMKFDAMLINTSRGPLVDAKALVDCLKSGKLRGAALDVYEHEDKYFYKNYSQRIMNDDILARLISMHNTIMTSHQAFLTEEALKTIAESIIQNFLEFFNQLQTDGVKE
ncbi:unnamed protein product, partial [Rotaria magnacalcarata]